VRFAVGRNQLKRNHLNSTQLNSSLFTTGSQMAKRNTVHTNKSNDQSE